jgi:hypothetical protein
MDQYRLVMSVGASGVSSVFRLGVENLGGILCALCEGEKHRESGNGDDIDEQIVAFLEKLSSVPRFDLALQFLSAEERSARDTLLGRLCQRVGEDRISFTRKSFGE